MKPFTKEQAEALTALQQHIVAMDAKYGEPEDAAEYLSLTMYEVWNRSLGYQHVYERAQYWLSGTEMHIDSTFEEREERLRLLRAYLGE